MEDDRRGRFCFFSPRPLDEDLGPFWWNSGGPCFIGLRLCNELLCARGVASRISLDVGALESAFEEGIERSHGGLERPNASWSLHCYLNFCYDIFLLVTLSSQKDARFNRKCSRHPRKCNLLPAIRSIF